MTFKSIVTTFAIVALISTATIGLINLLIWDYNRDQAEREKNCANIAELANISEWKADSYNCYILKDGKIRKVEL